MIKILYKGEIVNAPLPGAMPMSKAWATRRIAMELPSPEGLNSQRERILEGLRIFGANYTAFTRRFAASLGLRPTDADALVELLYAEGRAAPSPRSPRGG